MIVRHTPVFVIWHSPVHNCRRGSSLTESAMSSTAATVVAYVWPTPDTFLRWHRRSSRQCNRRRMMARYAASRTGFISHRRAETAQPHSWTVPPSMTKPRLSNERRTIWLAVGFWGSNQTTSTPTGLKNSTSQSSAVSRVLNVRRRQSTNATSYWPAGWPQFAVAPREHSRGDAAPTSALLPWNQLPQFGAVSS